MFWLATRGDLRSLAIAVAAMSAIAFISQVAAIASMRSPSARAGG
jgi:hypothetical protein